MPLHSGKYQPTNIEKYRGNPSEIHFRSSWERLTFKWCDHNPDVKWWSSERTAIPYKCKTDGKTHIYNMDLTLCIGDKVYMIEIKPEYQTLRPVKKNKSKERFAKEVYTWAKNVSKWEAADQYAKSKGMNFQIWTESTLWKLGINVKN